MKKLLGFLFMIISLWATAQTGSEIYLFDVSLTKFDVSISNPVNVTNRPGYDNQPFFHTSKPFLYYSSFNEDGRSDIKVYNYQNQETKSFTTTFDREYSPTLTPDAKFISCVIQRDNGAQDLGKYPVNGGEAITLIDSMIVGYHAWANDNNLILFILGDTVTLQWYDLVREQNTILDVNIGRSLHKIPGQHAMSYVKKYANNEWTINRLDISSKKITTITTTLPERDDHSWTNDGKILMSDGERIFFFDTKTKSEWKEVNQRTGAKSLKGITRLAMTKDGEKLAVVISE